MAQKQIPFCSDEELLEELKKLGYDEVPNDVFQLMKQDLFNMVSAENSGNINSSKVVKASKPDEASQFLQLKRKQVNSMEDSSFNNLYSNVNGLLKSKRNLAYNVESSEKLPDSLRVFDKKNDDEVSYTNQSLLTMKHHMNKFPGVTKCEINSFDIDLSNAVSQGKNASKNSILIDESKCMTLSDTVESLEDTIDYELSDNGESSGEVPSINISFSKYKNNLKNYKLYNMAKRESNCKSIVNGGDAISDIESSFSSLSIKRKLKRKVLQHKEGKPVIQEKIVDIPSIFNSSYPETPSNRNSSKLTSSFDLSFKSNSSTGSLNVLSPESLTSPRSTVTVSTTSRSKITPRRKKNDPVAMYNYYKKFWDNFQPPGEKNHDKIRWAVRDRMLDYSL